VLSIALLFGALFFMYLNRGAALPATEGSSTWNFSNVLSTVVNIIVPAMGIMLASRRPENPIGWMFLTAGLLLGVGEFGVNYALHGLVVEPGSLPAPKAFAWVSNTVGILPVGVLAFLFLLFPTGHIRSRRWRPAFVVVTVAAALLFVSSLVGATQMWNDPFASPTGSALLGLLFVVPLFAMLIVSLTAVVVRYRGATGDERLQLKWFATGAALVVLSFVASFFLSPSASAAAPPLVSIFQSLAFILLWSGIGVAVLKYRLYEIDVVINRTVVYGSLAVFITLVYVGLVVGVGTLVGDRGSPLLSAIAAAIVAVAFQPMRSRAGRFANRIVYGKRATPYEVLSDFAERMGGTYSIDDVLPRTARMLAEGTGAVRADVWLVVGFELRPAGSWPALGPPGSNGSARPDRATVAADGSISVAGASRAVPVRFQGDLLGGLSVQKSPGDPLTAVDDKLLADVAAQAGLVLHNVRLIEELRASRQRMVTAQDEARRRLERNIHDGAQQQLVALAVKLNLVGAVVGNDDDKARAIIDQLKVEANDALENLRDLARGIYPPLLADRGLVPALEAQARKSAIPVTLETDGVGRYPQEVEAAVYFCTLEALQNIAKYSRATAATVRLRGQDGVVTFEVHDDGAGFDPRATTYGSGLQGMADRLSALGGRLEIRSSVGQGTTVAGELPAAVVGASTPG
jgi:signal transduction histidine kinase